MPLPSPRKDEDHSKFKTRCMGDGVMKKEYPDRKQRNAVCESQWKKKEKAMGNDWKTEENLALLCDETGECQPCVMDAIMADPWMITEDWMQTIISIATRAGKSPEGIAFKAPDKVTQHQLQIRGDNGIVNVKGPIFRYANLFTEISGATSVTSVARQFSEALSNPKVKTIILNIDSPGGQANGINELAETIYAARQQKKIVAYVGGSGTSAAYWIASAAGKLEVDDTGILGSIGVVLSVRKRDDSSIEFVSSSSPNKRPDPETDAGKKEIISFLDSMAEVFVDKVARNRDITSAKVLSDFGRGGLVVGAKAVAVGMADSLGSFEKIVNGGKTMPDITTKAELEEQLPEVAAALREEGKAEIDTVRTELEAKVEASEAEVEKAKIENLRLRKASLLKELTVKAGEERAKKLIGLHEKLESADLEMLGDMIADLLSTIDELGAAKGSTDVDTTLTKDQLDAKVKAYAEEHGIESETDAYVEYMKAHPEKTE